MKRINLRDKDIKFCKGCSICQQEGECFLNTWFFDEENKLFSIAAKFAEPSIWYRHIKENFFEARGYELEGEMTVIGECEPGFEKAFEKSEEKYQQWKIRQCKSEDHKFYEKEEE